MQISNDTLSRLFSDDKSEFVRIFQGFAHSVLNKARFEPVLSKVRLFEVRGAWKNDVSRVGTHEPNLGVGLDGLDHFKHAGLLAFWLRRFAPLIECNDITQNFSDSSGYPLTDFEIEFRKILAGYANEYLAFDFGFQIVKFYEIGLGSQRAINLRIDRDYYETMCHHLKYKSTSPHAMHLI
jgi:hypothetical protein